jgi:ABC-type dipeptide/oligopeptide/nickel transport system ATPase subunit
MKNDVSPSAALQDMLDNPNNYTIDCAQFVDLERLIGMRNSMGDDSFDKYIKKQGNGKFEIKQHGSTGVNNYMTDIRGKNGKFQSVGGGPFKFAKERMHYDKLPIGTRLWIGSIGYQKSPWNGENIIKVGRNRYNAQGLGENMKLRQIKKELAKRQTPVEGEKQKIGLSRALIRKPLLLLLDEPVAPLDFDSRSALYDLLRIESENRLVLVVSHDDLFDSIATGVWRL